MAQVVSKTLLLGGLALWNKGFWWSDTFGKCCLSDLYPPPFSSRSRTFKLLRKFGSKGTPLPPFLTALQHMEFPGQGSDLSCNCSPNHSCGNAGSPTCCASLGIEPVSQGSQDAADPVVPQWELQKPF